MAIKIEVIKVDIEAKGKFQQATIAYYGPDRKVDAKKLVSFKNKDVYDKLTNALPGDVFEVTSEKDEKGYWQWTSASSLGKNTDGTGTAPATGRPTTATRSTYETPEERALRQVYIVRQSSVSNAIAFYEAVKGKPSVDDVLATAKTFEKFVFDTDLQGDSELPPVREVE